MRAPFLMRSLLLILTSGLAAACGDNLPRSTIAGTGGIDGAGGSQAIPSATPVGGTRVFSGTARMLAAGPSCTQEAGATGDRWCAFLTFTDPVAQIRSLFVFNASRAIAGQPVTCAPGGGDPNCLLLTDSLGVDAGGPTLHGTFFKGDSLVYYQNQHGSLVPYIWRPGMAAGRLLATFAQEEDAVYCTPAPQGLAVVCVLLPASYTDPHVGYATLLMGRADGPTEPLLSPADDVIVWNSNDDGFQQAFSFGFPPGAGNVAWTTRDTPTGPEMLKMQVAGDPTTKTEVAAGVHQWDVSPDGSHWYWLSPNDGVITLQKADFPSGANPVDLYRDVVDYSLGPADGTLVARTSDYLLLSITERPGSTVQVILDTQVRSLQSFSASGYVAYSKTYFDSTSGDLYVKSARGGAACPLEATHPVPFKMVSFSPDGGAILWAHSDGDVFQAHYGRLRDCDAMSVADDITLIKSIGVQRVLFVDGYDDEAGTGTLRVRTVGGDNLLGGETPVSIAEHVDSYSILGPGPDALLYTVNATGADDGVYVRWFAD